MTDIQLSQLKFPIGPFMTRENISNEELHDLIGTIEGAPQKYSTVAGNLSQRDLLATYREGAWNVQQLVNHVADMQLLHFFRMKKALTEMLNTKGAYLLEVMVGKENNVFPMVPQGCSVAEIRLK